MLFSYEDRVIKEGRFIAENGATVRKTAEAFGMGKSSVHKDVHEKLKEYDSELYAEVCAVLKNNFAVKHLRGGLATKNKFVALRKKTADEKLQ